MEEEPKMADHLHSLLHQGIVDDQFLQLYQLQDESNPDFVAEVVALYFEDSERLLEELTKTLSQEPVDFKVVDAYVHQLKGSCSSLGVLRVKNACIAFRSFYESSDLQGCWQALQQLKQEYIILKSKLEELLEANAVSLGLDSSWTPNEQIDHSFEVHAGETMTS
eukprot:c18287_g1_i1 orf=251-745(-)